MTRVRKAYQVTIRGFDGPKIVYAPTHSKACASAFRDLRDVWDISFRDFLKQSKVRRAPWSDVTLPDRHPLAPQLDAEILHCVVHAYGGTGLKAGYRDHFYTSESEWRMKAAYYHSLFERYRVDKRYAGGPDMVMYSLTTLGRNGDRGEAEHYPAH